MIKAGVICAVCSRCGKIYHESCASRVRKCPKCGAEFTAKTSKPSQDDTADAVPKSQISTPHADRELKPFSPEPSREEELDEIFKG